MADEADHPGVPNAPARHEPAKITDAVARDVTSVLHIYRTEYGIYGVVLVSALIAIGWESDTDLDVLLFVLGTVGVFWLAHVYAGTLAREKSDAPRLRAILAAAWAAVRHSIGMIIAMVLPAVFLLLAVVGVLDEYVAYFIALWVGVAVLLVLGYLSAARRRSAWYWRVVSALVTASLGLLVIWLSALVH